MALDNYLAPMFSSHSLSGGSTTGLQGFNALGSSNSNIGNVLNNNQFSSWAAPTYDISGINGLGTSSEGLFGKLGGIQGIMSIASTIGGLMNGLNQYKIAKQALGLAREQFGFEKGLANRNLANQSKTINNLYDSQSNIAAGLAGASLSDERAARYGVDKSAVQQQYNDAAKERHVDGSPIG